MNELRVVDHAIDPGLSLVDMTPETRIVLHDNDLRV